MALPFGGRVEECDWLKCTVSIGIAPHKLWWPLELSGDSIYSHTKSGTYGQSPWIKGIYVPDNFRSSL